MGSARFSVMAASATLRKNFVTSAIQMIQDHGFDGLDVDWEYPNRRDTVYGQADIDNFTQLLRELREEFDKTGLFLSAAVSAVRDMAVLSYDIPAISRYLDLINIMTYDMYGAWDPVTGHNAPLHKGEGDGDANKQDLFTVDVALDYWLDQGTPPEKIAIGVPFYGRSFILRNPSNAFVRAPALGAGIAGPYTATNGMIGYNEFCTRLQSELWTRRYDDSAKVPYAHNGQNWVSHDDADSIILKIQHALDRGVAGAMVWSIETDDFHGTCGDGDFPLLRAVNRAVGRDGSESSTTASSSTASSTTGAEATTQVTSSTEGPDSNGVICTEEGFAPDPEDCSSFYMCVEDRYGNIQPWKFECPADLVWDQINSVCNYPELVECNVYTM